MSQKYRATDGINRDFPFENAKVRICHKTGTVVEEVDANALLVSIMIGGVNQNITVTKEYAYNNTSRDIEKV